MKNVLATLMRISLFAVVFVVWMWVLGKPLSETMNLSIIIGAVVLVFPIVWVGRILLDRDPTPASAEWMTAFIHAAVMTLFGSAIIRALTTYESWRGWLIPLPAGIGLLLAIITGALAVFAVVNLALRGWGAPFAIALSRRLASDWMYAWTRNPMVLATLAFLVALGIYLRSTLFILWVCFLAIPALLFFVKLFEERELEIRFGDPYLQYKARTPMLLPRKPAALKPISTGSKGTSKATTRKRATTRTSRKRGKK